MHDWLVVGADIFLGSVGQDEAQADGRGGQDKQDGVQDFRVDFATTLEGAMDEHRLATEKDEAEQHESGVGVELLFPVRLPGQTVVVLVGPVEPQKDGGKEKQLGQSEQDAQQEAAT